MQSNINCDVIVSRCLATPCVHPTVIIDQRTVLHPPPPPVCLDAHRVDCSLSYIKRFTFSRFFVFQSYIFTQAGHSVYSCVFQSSGLLPQFSSLASYVPASSASPSTRHCSFYPVLVSGCPRAVSFQSASIVCKIVGSPVDQLSMTEHLLLCSCVTLL